jgi:predicted secreted protein
MVDGRTSPTLRAIPVLIAVCLLGLPAHAKYSGGTGEPNDPYQIATAADLIALGNEPNDYDKCFLLTADIDLDPNLPGGRVFDRAVIAADTDAANWRFQGTPFTGVFDGKGHTISRLTIEGGSYLGLFGQIGAPAVVSNLFLEAVDVKGTGDYVGGLVGGSNHAIVSQCYSTAIVRGAWCVGGLVGVNGRGAVTQCYSAGTVSGVWYLGGLVGLNNGVVTYCYSTGSVSGSQFIGGLVGSNAQGSSISDCYSTGSVSGDYDVGGLIGLNGRYSVDYDGPDGVVIRCYSTGPVSGSGPAGHVGGLVGNSAPFDGEEVVFDCFWNMQTSSQAESGGGTGKTTAEMQTAKTFLDGGWDFVGETANGPNDVWKIAEGLDYPRLWWEPYDGQVTVELGQVFAVTLESNPSTGYGWEWIDEEDSIVEQVGEAQFKGRDTGDPPLVGAGGWEVLTFKAVSPGQMTLKLVYRRAWEEGVEPLKTFLLHVVVP